MQEKNYGLVRYACYMVSASMAVVSTLSPLLFLSFRNLYDISFSKLGALVFINFTTQLVVDLVLSFYSHKFSMERLVRLTPVLTAMGLFVSGLFPFIFPGRVYLGLLMGTVIFSAASGLAEVLISPVIAALPSDNPEREMSKLHSAYAWGVVVVVVVSTLLLTLLGRENWQWLAFFWMLVPLTAFFLFSKSTISELETPERASKALSLLMQKEFLICLACIALGGASECTMAQWSSSYLEQALNISKVWGDIFGVALFAVMLGTGRTLYSRIGKNIYRTLAISAVGATACYLVAAFSNIPLVGLAACALTGLCTAMLWPGSLIVVSEKFPKGGVAIFAFMAAAGDLGAAVGPQLVGSVTDLALKSERTLTLFSNMNLTSEQGAIKIGLLSALVFPVLATLLYTRNFLKKKQEEAAKL
ncbi:MAG: MFS transporter [Clostridiales bacterium]|nr:MFS transporter [Clostridiales bacterium]